MRPLLSAFAIVFALGCRNTPPPDPQLRAAILQRAQQDQQEMQALAAHWADSAYHRQLAATLSANALWLDSLVAQRGWPGFAAVDSAGTAAAFLIAQHADTVPEAQRRLLAALQVAVRAHDAPPRDLAYLEDRVRKAAGRPQLYGTQPAYDSTGAAIQPLVESPESLDVRRAAVGLPPMTVYLDQMRAMNAQLRAQQPAKPR